MKKLLFLLVLIFLTPLVAGITLDLNANFSEPILLPNESSLLSINLTLDSNVTGANLLLIDVIYDSGKGWNYSAYSASINGTAMIFNVSEADVNVSGVLKHRITFANSGLNISQPASILLNISLKTPEVNLSSYPIDVIALWSYPSLNVTEIKNVSLNVSVFSYGSINLKVFNASGTPLDANITINSKPTSASIKAIEGVHRIKIEKAGHVPVEFDVSLARGENLTYSVILARPEELDTPKLIFAKVEGFNELENAMNVLGDTGLVKPNANVKAHRYLNLSTTVEGKIAVKVPKLVRGNLSAWFNDSISITVNGNTTSYEEVVINGEKVLVIDVNGSATVSMEFEGKELGNVTSIGDGTKRWNPDKRQLEAVNVTPDDALAILQYFLYKRTNFTTELWSG